MHFFFILIQVLNEPFILHEFLDLGSYKCTFLDFCVTHIWELIPNILESTAGFIHAFTNYFMRPSFMCKGAEKYSPEEQEED